MQQARNGAVSQTPSSRSILSLNNVLLVPLLVASTVSIFGFLSLGLFPIPLIFIRYGKQLRARSRYGQEAREVIMRMGEYNCGGTIEPGTPRLTKKQVTEDAEQTSLRILQVL